MAKYTKTVQIEMVKLVDLSYNAEITVPKTDETALSNFVVYGYGPFQRMEYVEKRTVEISAWEHFTDKIKSLLFQ